MRTHLSGQEMLDALEAAPSAEVLDHLAACARCRDERDRLQVTMTGMAEQSREDASRPEAAWDRQTRQIMARVREPRRVVLSWRWGLAPALVGLAALAVVWFHGQTARISTPVENDEAFLAAVQDSVGADVPTALRPLALLLDAVEERETIPGLTGRRGG